MAGHSSARRPTVVAAGATPTPRAPISRRADPLPARRSVGRDAPPPPVRPAAPTYTTGRAAREPPGDAGGGERDLHGARPAARLAKTGITPTGRYSGRRFTTQEGPTSAESKNAFILQE